MFSLTCTICSYFGIFTTTWWAAIILIVTWTVNLITIIIWTQILFAFRFQPMFLKTSISSVQIEWCYLHHVTRSISNENETRNKRNNIECYYFGTLCFMKIIYITVVETNLHGHFTKLSDRFAAKTFSKTAAWNRIQNIVQSFWNKKSTVKIYQTIYSLRISQYQYRIIWLEYR